MRGGGPRPRVGGGSPFAFRWRTPTLNDVPSHPPVMPRLFTALEIPSEIVQSMARLRGGLPGARWVEPENYHLTLRFIGDVDDALAEEIADLLSKVERPAVDLRIDGLDSLGVNRPRAGVPARSAAAELVELQADHERIMQRVG